MPSQADRRRICHVARASPDFGPDRCDPAEARRSPCRAGWRDTRHPTNHDVRATLRCTGSSRSTGRRSGRTPPTCGTATVSLPSLRTSSATSCGAGGSRAASHASGVAGAARNGWWRSRAKGADMRSAGICRAGGLATARSDRIARSSRRQAPQHLRIFFSPGAMRSAGRVDGTCPVAAGVASPPAAPRFAPSRPRADTSPWSECSRDRATVRLCECPRSPARR